MKNLYPILVLTLLTFSIDQLSAQTPGYIVNKKNDTLKCKVWNATFGNAVKYEVNDNGKTLKIKIDSVKEYQLTRDSSRYRALTLKDGGKPEFFQMLEEGKICLYVQYITTSTGPNTTGTTTNWYVSKDMGRLISLKTNAVFGFGASHDDRKNQLADLFSDEPKVAAAYKADDSFSFKKIRKYIQEYNLAYANSSRPN